MNKKLKTRPSSQDVADLAKVSRATVSRAYNPTYNLNEDLKRKVMLAAEELGYKPNILARSLQTKKTNIIGILVRNMNNPFYSIALDHLIYGLQEAKYQSLIFVSKDNRNIDTVLDTAFQYQVDAMIIFASLENSIMPKEFVEKGIPTILFNRYTKNSRASSICLDDISMGRKVAQEFYRNGHKNFCFISGDEEASTIINRKNGFIEELKELGINNCLIVKGGVTYNDGWKAAKKLFKENKNIDACFCCCDIVAFGFLDFIRHNTNKRIPEDIAIVGFDDLPMASNINYNLTTISQPWKELVKEAIDLVEKEISSEETLSISKIIKGKYISRGTTRS